MPLRPLLILALTTAAFAADLPPKPATKPTSQPARIRESLMNGAIRFLIPEDWEPIERTEDGKLAKYTLPDGQSNVALLVTQQEQAVPHNHPKLRQQLVQYCLAMAEQDVKNRGADLIEPVKVEKDDRFMARVRVRVREGGRTVDSVHFYRGVGINLLSVNANAYTDDPKAAKETHEAGALLLLGVTTGTPNARK